MTAIRKVISVFGSANPVEGSPDYVQAERVGQLLAEAGYAVLTGGYMGIMEAASRGAAAVGGHVIGVTSEQIEAYRPIKPNPYITEEIKYRTLRERLLHVVTENDGMIVLPGGIGTLAELALSWNMIQVNELSPRPLILVGSLWHDMLHSFMHHDYVKPPHFEKLLFADSAENTIQNLTNFYAP